MNEEKNKTSIYEAVTEKLKSSKVVARPRLFFVVKGILIFVLILLVLVVALFTVSLVMFALRANGLGAAPTLGWWGIGVLARSLPWVLVLVAALSILVLELSVNRFRFAYRRPALYSLVVLIFVVAVGSLMAGQFDMHPKLYRRAVADKLPFFAPVYRYYGPRPFIGAHPGLVEEMQEYGFDLREFETNYSYKVLVEKKTRLILPPDESLIVGEKVIVFGEDEDGKIRARAIVMPPDDLPEWPHRDGDDE